MDFAYCPYCGNPLELLRDGPDEGRLACRSRHFVHYDNAAVTVQGWIRDGDEFLILQRAIEPMRGEWDIPGGFVDGGEHPVDAMRREVEEETGLLVSPRRLIGIYTSTYGDGGRHTIDIAYLASIKGGRFALSPESRDGRWLTLDRFPELAFPSERKALRDLLRRQGPV